MESFTHRTNGHTAKAAFDMLQLVIEPTAQADPDYDGPDGSMLDKTDFVMIDPPAGFVPSEAEAEARRLIDARDVRITDAYGPAGCFDLGGGDWLFFGLVPAAS